MREHTECRIASLPAPTTLETMSTIVITAISGAVLFNISIFFEKNRFRIRPIITGARITYTVLKNRPHASTSTLLPISHPDTKGVIATAIKVDIVVIVTDNGTFAPASQVTTFEAVPPGQQATNIIPAAIAGGKL